MQIELYTDWTQASDALTDQWESLLKRTAVHATFMRPFWHGAWWEAYQSGKSLRLLAARDDDGTLMGLAPLFQHELDVQEGLLPPVNVERPNDVEGDITRRFLHPLGGTEVSDYLDWVVDADVAEPVYRALWGYLRDEMTDWDILDLHCIPAESPTLQWLPELAREDGREAQVVKEEVCPVIHLPDDWETYLDGLDKKQRHEIRRKIRKANREVDVSWRQHGPEDDLEQDLEQFIELHESSTADKEAFWNPATRRFFQQITADLKRLGDLELSFIYFNGQPVATLLCFMDQGDMLVYNSGYLSGHYRSLSSGLVLLAFVIEDAIERGVKRFDFLRGDERYKYDFGGSDRMIYRLGIAGR